MHSFFFIEFCAAFVRAGSTIPVCLGIINVLVWHHIRYSILAIYYKYKYLNNV